MSNYLIKWQCSRYCLGILPVQYIAQHALQWPAAAWCAVERSDEYLCTGEACCRHTVE